MIEKITSLPFLRRLDVLHTLEEHRAARLEKSLQRRIFPVGAAPPGRADDSLRWSHVKNQAPPEMFIIVGEHVFPDLRTLGSDDSTEYRHMKDARFSIPTPALLAKVVDLLDAVPMDNRDTKRDLHEYLLGKIARAGELCVGPKPDLEPLDDPGG